MSAQVILLVEDDPSGRELAEFNLREAGQAVDAVRNGDEALSRFDPARHRLVVTDLRMPGASGMQVLSHVRSRAPNVPVIVVTAYGDVALAVEAMKAGATDFLGKPFSREQLLAAVADALAGVADPLRSWPPLPDEGLSLLELERRVIERALVRHRGNVSRTAAYLGVPRHVLVYRMEKYGIRRT
jgi:DNA-binding NtrC family response regulator